MCVVGRCFINARPQLGLSPQSPYALPSLLFPSHTNHLSLSALHGRTHYTMYTESIVDTNQITWLLSLSLCLLLSACLPACPVIASSTTALDTVVRRQRRCSTNHSWPVASERTSTLRKTVLHCNIPLGWLSYSLTCIQYHLLPTCCVYTTSTR